MPQRKAPVLTVLVDGVADKRLRPIVSQRSHGGGRMDFARCVVDRTGLPLMQDFALHVGGNKTVEIIGDFKGHRKVYFWGRESQTGIRIDERRETQEVVFTIDPWLLGVPVWGQVVWNPQSGTVDHVDRDLVFNPIHNGKVRGNARHPFVPIPGRTTSFVDPASLATENAEAYSGDPLRDYTWRLSEVIHYLCWHANPEQRYVTNPTQAEIRGVVDNSKDHVRDLRIKPGLYLPDLLDYVLEPFGYGWFVELTKPGQRQLTFFKRGVGRRKMFVGLQRPGQTVKAGPEQTNGSNVAACDIAIDFSRLYNQVRGLGDFLEIEATFTLAPGWETSKDGLADNLEVLKKSSDNPLFEANRDVYRKFVLNEAGDYNGLRPTLRGPHDFRTLIARALGINPNDAARFCVPKRRELLPTLTTTDDQIPIGDAGGVTVELFNGNSGISAWDLADDFRVLENECAIEFLGTHPPDIVLQQRGNALVRVTATIRFDQRLEGLAPRLASSAQSETAELVLDLRDRFHHRVIDSTSIYAADVARGDKKSLAEDDRLALFAYCAQIRDAWDIASVTGPVELEGIDWDYEIGDAITQIEGRNLSFNGKAQNTNATHFPTVVGITHDFQGQRTLLQLADWRNRVRFATDKQGIEEPV